MKDYIKAKNPKFKVNDKIKLSSFKVNKKFTGKEGKILKVDHYVPEGKNRYLIESKGVGGAFIAGKVMENQRFFYEHHLCNTKGDEDNE